MLSGWFATNGRHDLPWRRTRDPYADPRQSEVMLQQTQVARVIPRYQAWLERWPTVERLAAASPADVIREWQGLGYNRRALNLHRAARRIAADGWPDDLTDLPGVGPLHRDAAVRASRSVVPCSPSTSTSTACSSEAAARSARERAQALDGPRCDDLPRTHPALRAVPARGRMPVTGPPLRAGAQAGPVRGLVPPAARESAARCRGSPQPAVGLDVEAVAALARDGLVQIDDGLVRLPD